MQFSRSIYLVLFVHLRPQGCLLCFSLYLHPAVVFTHFISLHHLIFCFPIVYVSIFATFFLEAISFFSLACLCTYLHFPDICIHFSRRTNIPISRFLYFLLIFFLEMCVPALFSISASFYMKYLHCLLFLLMLILLLRYHISLLASLTMFIPCLF